MRVFALEHIREASLAADRFQKPADFDPADYLKAAWGIVRGTLVTARVAFTKSAAPYIRERLWHPTQRLRDLPDGRLELTLQVADTQEVRPGRPAAARAPACSGDARRSRDVMPEVLDCTVLALIASLALRARPDPAPRRRPARCGSHRATPSRAIFA